MRRSLSCIAIISIACLLILGVGCVKNNIPATATGSNNVPVEHTGSALQNIRKTSPNLEISQQEMNSTFQNNDQHTSEDTCPEIDVQSPMTLSNTELTFGGQPAYLRLKMVKGRYYEDWNPGAYMGTLWEGNFVIELADEFGKTIAETDISKMFSEPLTFKSSFDLEFDDYNKDGNLDFTIGQYASGNGRVYKIFTLRKDGKIDELPVKDHPEMFISNSTGYYSAKLNKIDGTTFETEYYDNSVPATFRNIYQWDGKQFVLLSNKKMTGMEVKK